MAHEVLTELFLWVEKATDEDTAPILDLDSFLMVKIKSLASLIQRKARYRPRGLTEATAQEVEKALGKEPNPLQGLLALAVLEAIEAARSELTPQQAKVYEMRVLKEMSVLEIAHELGITPSTVSNHLTPAFARIRAAIKKARGLADSAEESGHEEP